MNAIGLKYYHIYKIYIYIYILIFLEKNLCMDKFDYTFY